MTPPMSTRGLNSGRVLPNRTSEDRDATQPQERDRTKPSPHDATTTKNSGEAVGIVGGSGDVGAAAAGFLAAAGIPVRVGGRRASAAAAVAAAIGAEARTVDITDADSLRGFVAGCRLVLNCVGPGEFVAARVRAAVIAGGTDYVDVMSGPPGDTTPADGRVAVLAAGLCPGLSGLLPGLLADGLDAVEDVEAGYCGLGVFTESAAIDYLVSVRGGFGTSMAALCNGRVRPAALSVDEDYRLPGLLRTVTAHPFLTEELRARAVALGIPSARWYNAFDGEHLLAALARFQRDADPTASLDAAAIAPAAAAIVRASALDAAGRTPYHLLHATARGTRAGEAIDRTVVVRGTDGSRLTGAVAAIAVEAVLAGAVPPGIHRAASVLSPRHTVDRLREHLPDVLVAMTERPTVPEPMAVGIVEGEL